MPDELLQYYERELTYLRRLGAEFAKRYPKVAGRLQLEPTKSEDPHVERLLEGVAFLAARVHRKIDADFPEVSEALLDVVYPHAVRPIPSMTTAEFHLDPEQGRLTTGLRIPRGTTLFARPAGGVSCRFSTCYDTTLWPFAVAAAQWTTPERLRPAVRAPDAAAALRVELRCPADVRFDALDLRTLRLHLAGEGNLTHTLYELLAGRCLRVIAREPGGGAHARQIVLPADALQPAGFAADEGVLPAPRHTFLGYRLLQEYFTFPDKFLYFELSGLEALRAAGFGPAVELVFLVAPFERAERRPMLEAGVTEATVRLGCTPAVNLFPQTAEPVLLTQRSAEYLVVPDARRRLTTEAYAVEEVVGVTAGAATAVPYEPFYSARHAADVPVYWRASRRPGTRPDGGTDLYLSFADLSGRTVYPDEDAASVRLLCFNGDLPSRLPFGGTEGDFDMQGGGAVRRIEALVKPTPAIQPPLGTPQLWRLISQLSLNHLSLVEEGAEALREILRLHNAGDSAAGEKHVQAVTAVRSEPAVARLATPHGLAFARGRRVALELDEEQFAGAGAYLFASVLDRFLAMYASMNSFTQLAARTPQRRAPLHVWPPRSGWKTLA